MFDSLVVDYPGRGVESACHETAVHRAIVRRTGGAGDPTFDAADAVLRAVDGHLGDPDLIDDLTDDLGGESPPAFLPAGGVPMFEPLADWGGLDAPIQTAKHETAILQVILGRSGGWAGRPVQRALWLIWSVGEAGGDPNESTAEAVEGGSHAFHAARGRADV